MGEGQPLHGDRAAWDSVSYATEHAKDISDGTLRRHLAAPGTAGNLMQDDGTNWVSVAPSSNPGASSKILMTDGSGYLQLERLGLGIAPGAPLHVLGTYTYGSPQAYPAIISGVGANDTAPAILLLVQNTESGGSGYSAEAHLRLDTTSDARKYINFSEAEEDIWLAGATSAAGAADSVSGFIIYRSSVGSGTACHRLRMLGTQYTALNSVGAYAVRINYDASDTATGTEGLEVYTGGAADPDLWWKLDASLTQYDGAGSPTGMSVSSAGRGRFEGLGIGVAPGGPDIYTDRWLGHNSNLFLGIGVIGAGNLAHGSGNEGYYNVALGYGTMYAATTAADNVAIGYSALYDITTGYRNIAIGSYAGTDLTTGFLNFALGYQALFKSTDGAYNVALGAQSLYNLTSGQSNMAIGYYALNAVTTAYYNVGIGPSALLSVTTAWSNVAIGASALRSTTGANSVGIGTNAGRQQGSGANNVFIGDSAGYGSGAYNASGCVLIGYQAGYNNGTSNRLYIENSNSATPLIYGEFDNDEVGINIGAGCAATLHIDQPSGTGAKPVILLDQADVSEEFARYVGQAAAATLTQSFVAEGDVSTATRIGWKKVYIVDDGNQIADGPYYEPFYSLS